MNYLRVLTILLAFPLVALATAAHAYDQKTRYFTIRVLPPNDNGVHLFVTQVSGGLRLERYRSGDARQMWTAADRDYPTAPTVTGGSPYESFLECFTGACGFKGNAVSPPSVRVVNRSSGRCLALGATRAIPIECANTDNNPTEARWQRLEAFNDITRIPAGDFTSFATAGGNCLAANSDEEYADGMSMRSVPCGENLNWTKLFATNFVAAVSCRSDWDWQLCFD